MELPGGTSQAPKKPKFIQLERAQSFWGPIDLESLIERGHSARAIWELTGRLDLGSFEQGIRSHEGEAGAPVHSPRVLVSVWVYAYSQGVASARAVERMMAYEPGLRWLCADQAVNHKTLSAFRTIHGDQLKDLFAKVLAVIAEEGLLELSTLMQDGTKVQAVASKQSFHREATLHKKCEQARAVVEQLELQSETEGAEKQDGRRQAAQQRAAREKLERMKASLEELKKRQQDVAASKQAEVRVSDSEPEARKMLQTDGGFAPSYNLQLTTEPKSKMIVGVEVSDAPNDTHELIPALDRMQEQYGQQPQMIVADGGYATRDNVEKTESRQVQLVAPWKDDQAREAGARKRNGLDPEYAPSKFTAVDQGQVLECPAGNRLVQIKQHIHHGQTYVVYQAQAEQCAVCGHKPRCLKEGEQARRVERVRETEAMKAFLARQQLPEIQQLYKKRKAVAEFPQLRFKGNWGLRRFTVRGLAKVNKEAIWIALAHNVSQWCRLSWLPRLATV
jgi:transposase